MNDTPTPLTDAESDDGPRYDCREEMVRAKFARDLELKLALVTKERDEAKRDLITSEQVTADLLAQLEGCRTERDELLRKLALCRNALDTLSLVVGLTAVKHASQLPPLQEAVDYARKTFAETAP